MLDELNKYEPLEPLKSWKNYIEIFHKSKIYKSKYVDDHVVSNLI